MDDCKDLEVRAENNKLRLELQKTQEKLGEILRTQDVFVQSDLSKLSRITKRFFVLFLIFFILFINNHSTYTLRFLMASRSLSENLRKTVKLLQDDIVSKKRKIDHLEAELRIANKASRHFEVRIVNE